MDTATTIRFCDLVIGLVNYVEFLAFALPIAGLLASSLIVTSRRLKNAGHAIARKSSQNLAARKPRFPVPARRRQPRPHTALIVAA